MDGLVPFQQFFEHCVGHWSTERTYHYLSHQQIERSHTDFAIEPLTPQQKQKVLSDNQYDHSAVDDLPGFHLAFDTVSETGEQVSQALNLLFVPKATESSLLLGDYLRDRAYEEARPIVSQFQFDPEQRQLRMTTFYTKVVSIDSITLVSPSLRLRQILNYRRPPEAEALTELLLVGFGVEQKVPPT
jgi:hypothetical protein